MKENTQNSEPIVYLLQEVPGTKIGRPKYNIIGAQKFGTIKVLLKEDTQIVRSPGPITYQLRRLLKDFSDKDFYFYLEILKLLVWLLLLRVILTTESTQR